jgi:hypothetical protein
LRHDVSGGDDAGTIVSTAGALGGGAMSSLTDLIGGGGSAPGAPGTPHCRSHSCCTW